MKHLMSTLTLLLFTSVATAFLPVSANVITTFQASGQFTDGTLLGGTLSIDTTTGTLQSYDLNATQGANSYAFLGTSAYLGSNNQMIIYDTNASGDLLDLGFNTSTFVSYTGGTLTSNDTPWVYNNIAYVSVFQPAGGQLVDLQNGKVSVPAPPSWLMMITGLCLLAPMCRRYRKAQLKAEPITA